MKLKKIYQFKKFIEVKKITIKKWKSNLIGKKIEDEILKKLKIILTKKTTIKQMGPSLIYETKRGCNWKTIQFYKLFHVEQIVIKRTRTKHE